MYPFETCLLYNFHIKKEKYSFWKVSILANFGEKEVRSGQGPPTFDSIPIFDSNIMLEIDSQVVSVHFCFWSVFHAGFPVLRGCKKLSDDLAIISLLLSVRQRKREDKILSTLTSHNLPFDSMT